MVFLSSRVLRHEQSANAGVLGRRTVTPDAAARDLFNGGPPTGLQTLLGLMAPGRPNYLQRICLAIAVGWLPLLVLTALQSVMLNDRSLYAFVTDYAAHARSLVAVPLLILAEKMCQPRLSSIVRHFDSSGLIGPQDRERFNHALLSTARFRDSMRLEVGLAILAVAFITTLFLTLSADIFPAWHRLDGRSHGDVSPAGWWNTLITSPILMILILGWLWRLALWSRFLWLVSRLNLHLVPAHPDGAGGLLFLGLSAQTFSILACAFGAAIAGTVANRLVHDGADLMSFRFVILGFDIACLLLFVSPLLVFSNQLLDAAQRGAQQYGVLAHRVGREMEKKWFGRNVDGDALQAPDFSATTDLYAIAANVYGIRLVPVAFRHLAFLAVGALLPFLPVVLIAVPPQLLVQKIASVLF